MALPTHNSFWPLPPKRGEARIRPQHPLVTLFLCRVLVMTSLSPLVPADSAVIVVLALGLVLRNANEVRAMKGKRLTPPLHTNRGTRRKFRAWQMF